MKRFDLPPTETILKAIYVASQVYSRLYEEIYQAATQTKIIAVRSKQRKTAPRSK